MPAPDQDSNKSKDIEYSGYDVSAGEKHKKCIWNEKTYKLLDI